MNGARLPLAACALAVALAAGPWLEASMARHMLVQLPLLVLAGWGFAGRAPARMSLARVDRHGIAGLTALLFVSAYWMIPRALEQALTSPLAALGKTVSLLVLGLILPGSLRRCPLVIQLFFLGNFSAMMAIAGIEYQDLPQRLCNAYLLDDQIHTGAGLVWGAIVIAAAWCLSLKPALARAQRG